WNLITRIDGVRTVEELARATGSNSFDTAKILYGLVTSDLIALRPRDAAARPASTQPGAASASAGRPSGTTSIRPGAASPSAVSPRPGGPSGPVPSPPLPPVLGDEKKILMILC